MHQAMGQYARYQKEAFAPKVVQIDTVPVEGCGGTGICNQETDWLMVDLYQGRYNTEHSEITTSSARRYERWTNPFTFSFSILISSVNAVRFRL